jgi:RNA polymerase sigma-70 factor (ECF subfamily)
VILDEIRARRHHETLEAAGEIVDPGVSLEDVAERSDDLRQLQALLAELPETHRAIVELRLAGLSDVEIAAIQDRSRKAVNVAQYRAVLQLRSLIGRESSGQGGRDD